MSVADGSFSPMGKQYQLKPFFMCKILLLVTCVGEYIPYTVK